MNHLNKNIIWVMIIIYLLPSFTIAQNNVCSNIGYTVLTINGINNTENDAKNNRRELERRLLLTNFNSQPVTVDFLYNPTHVLQTDLVDAIYQKYFELKSYNLQDSDFAHMLQDASDKVTTQKLLLVAHSQGNLYANTLYDAVADEDGGVPGQSIGVYGVASPASRVAGGGEYLTSDTDAVIIGAVAKFPYANVLKPNTHIELKPEDGNGHSFSSVYLKYKSDKIKGDIENALGRLQNNNIQKEDKACINPPKLTIAQKIQGATLAVMDNTVNFYNNSISFAGQKYLALINGAGDLLAGLFSGSNTGAVVLSEVGDNISPQQPEQNIPVISFEPEKQVENTNTEAIPPPKPQTEALLPSENEKVVIDNTPIVENISSSTPVNPPRLFVNISGGGGSAIAPTVETPPAPPAPPTPPEPTPDTTPPVITLIGEKEMTIPVGSVFTDPLATAIDDVEGILSVSVNNLPDTNTEGIYSIIYTAIDSSLNTASVERRVNVDNGAKISNPHAVFVKDNYAYIVSASNALEVVDVSDKVNPKHKSYLSHGVGGAELFNPSDVFVSGDYAYISSPVGNTFEILNISDPLSPRHVSTIKQSFDGANLMIPRHVSIVNNYAYVISAGQHKLDIIDISNPVSPVNIGQYYFGTLSVPTALYVSNGYAYVTYGVLGLGVGGLVVLDVSNPVSPILKSSVEDGQGGGVSILNPQSIFVANDIAYIASRGGDTIEMVDVSNKDLLVHKNIIHDGDAGAVLAQPSGLAVSGNNLFVTSLGASALEIIDITDTALPVHKAKLSDGEGGALLSYPESLYISGNYAYVASSGSNALEIIDISDSSHPVHTGKLLNGGF